MTFSESLPYPSCNRIDTGSELLRGVGGSVLMCHETKSPGGLAAACLAAVWNLVGFPLRAFLLPEPCQQRIGLTPLRDERYGKVAALVSGRVLDVACGDNTLVQSWLRPRGHRCVGLDKLRKDPDVVGDASWLPFRPGAFDSVAIVAAINHVPRRQREQCLVDVRRVLRRNGTLVVTMIGPFIGRLCHALTWWDPWPVHDRAEEDQGLRAGEVTTLAQAAGFQLVRKERFLYGLNTAFLFRKR